MLAVVFDNVRLLSYDIRSSGGIMIYPRIVTLKRGEESEEVLVDNTQCCGYEEHLADNYRLLFLSGLIQGGMEVHNLLMSLDSLSHEPIRLVITSAGGELDSTFLLYDTIRLIKSPVETIGRYCASAAAILLASGKRRYLFPHAKIMLHLPAGQMQGDAKEWDIQHRQMEAYRSKVVDILGECGVKKSREEILSDIDRDFWLEPLEAIEYGLADQIITPEIWEGICQQ